MLAILCEIQSIDYYTLLAFLGLTVKFFCAEEQATIPRCTSLHGGHLYKLHNV